MLVLRTYHLTNNTLRAVLADGRVFDFPCGYECTVVACVGCVVFISSRSWYRHEGRLYKIDCIKRWAPLTNELTDWASPKTRVRALAASERLVFVYSHDELTLYSHSGVRLHSSVLRRVADVYMAVYGDRLLVMNHALDLTSYRIPAAWR
jgi:hypothetical protein